MDNLTRSSKMWPKIKETLQKQNALDRHLTLRCQVHPAVFTKVSSAADFHKAPEGGCLQICGAALPCGHRCKSVCHILNREHENVRCSEQCERWGRCFMSENNCLYPNWRGRKNTADMHVGLTQFPSPSLWHSRQLQHWIVCVGFELDSTALEDEGTKFLHNTNHIAQCHIAESYGTEVLQITNKMAQCHIAVD